MRVMSLLLVLALPLSACTFVKMAPGADRVQVAAQSRDLSACQVRGEVVVSVKDRLGPYERDNLRVMDELETLARNEAPGLSADTVQPKGAPLDGEQRFLAYRCAGVAQVGPVRQDSAEVLPLKE